MSSSASSLSNSSISSEIESFVTDPEITNALLKTPLYKEVIINRLDDTLKNFNTLTYFLSFKIKESHKQASLIEKDMHQFQRIMNEADSDASIVNNFDNLNKCDNRQLILIKQLISDYLSVKHDLEASGKLYKQKRDMLLKKIESEENKLVVSEEEFNKIDQIHKRVCAERIREGGGAAKTQRARQLEIQILYYHSEKKASLEKKNEILDKLVKVERPQIFKKFIEMFVEMNEVLNLQVSRFYKSREQNFAYTAVTLFNNASSRSNSLNSVIDTPDPISEISSHLRNYI
ncbi:unnamed protein product [Ambrosiozyma monospora]|uniref:Unnamed protein product n=1 Tax=Ambrosiozyma monospora TaxID=43982 RepID=A0ACB5U6Y4_AMBMO|nr:unnamed protein product [Ambrosiozyma monospora]